MTKPADVWILKFGFGIYEVGRGESDICHFEKAVRVFQSGGDFRRKLPQG